MTQPLRPIVLSVAVDGLPPAALEDAHTLVGQTVTVGLAHWIAQGVCTEADVDVDGLLTIAVDKAEVR